MIHSFSLPKTVYYQYVQYSFSPYIVGELTVNQLTGFYCSSFTVPAMFYSVGLGLHYHGGTADVSV